jgi:hypothetical protein
VSHRHWKSIIAEKLQAKQRVVHLSRAATGCRDTAILTLCAKMHKDIYTKNSPLFCDGFHDRVTMRAGCNFHHNSSLKMQKPLPD